MRHAARLVLASLIAAVLVGTPGQSYRASADARLDSLVAVAERAMREHGVPGLALGIVNGDTVAIRGLGVASVEHQTPVGPHTVFPIASISKTFAATATLRLAEQGKVDLRDTVRRFLPDFKVPDEAVARDVTLWHLLTHTSGWEGQVAGPDRGEDTLRNFVATTMPDLMQLARPGTVWSYNNAGFSLLGRVIEVVTGTSINRAMRDLVFTPLALEHAGTTAGEFITHPFALGHLTRGGAPPALQRPFVPSVSVTAGGIGLCIADLISYARFHLGDGRSADGQQILPRAVLERMRSPQVKKHGTDDEMGLGWHLRRIGGVQAAAHGGTLAGHTLLLEIVPERQFAIALLTNANSGWRVIQEVERAALREYLGLSAGRNQAISHRGLVETLPDVEPLAAQPPLDEYVGTYRRPMNSVTVRADGGRLAIQSVPRTGTAQADMRAVFFGPDRAVVVEGPDRGQSIEFIRDDRRTVRWIRIVGRIAVREAAAAPRQPGVAQ